VLVPRRQRRVSGRIPAEWRRHASLRTGARQPGGEHPQRLATGIHTIPLPPPPLPLPIPHPGMLTACASDTDAMTAAPTPSATNASPVLRSQLGGVRFHQPPAGVHTVVGCWYRRPPPSTRAVSRICAGRPGRGGGCNVQLTISPVGGRTDARGHGTEGWGVVGCAKGGASPRRRAMDENGGSSPRRVWRVGWTAWDVATALIVSTRGEAGGKACQGTEKT
jgi:hypothetical protein